MKIEIQVPLKASVENVRWVLTYSKEYSKILPEIKEITYEKGSEEKFGAGTVILIKQLFKKREIISKVEVLEYQEGKYIVQRVTHPNHQITNRTSLLRVGDKTILKANSTLKFTSLLYQLMGPLLIFQIRKTYTKINLRLLQCFDPNETKRSIKMKITVAGIPGILFLFLCWLGTSTLFFVISLFLENN